jgi:hypothetical protein
MKAKTPIKIIKRDERNRQDKPADSPASARKSAPETARDIVATVSGWVNELQAKRRNDTARAIKTLLGETTPQTSKA